MLAELITSTLPGGRNLGDDTVHLQELTHHSMDMLNV
jgi:hypothetical protein